MEAYKSPESELINSSEKGTHPFIAAGKAFLFMTGIVTTIYMLISVPAYKVLQFNGVEINDLFYTLTSSDYWNLFYFLCISPAEFIGGYIAGKLCFHKPYTAALFCAGFVTVYSFWGLLFPFPVFMPLWALIAMFVIPFFWLLIGAHYGALNQRRQPPI